MPWHPLFGVEPTPAGLEPAVLTVILRGMAPDTGFEPINAESESAGLPISLIRYLAISDGIIHWSETLDTLMS